MPATFDTLKLARRLRQANFTEPQAEALAEALESVVTKLELAWLREERKRESDVIHEESGAFRVQMAAMERRLKFWSGVGFATTILVLGSLILVHQ